MLSNRVVTRILGQRSLAQLLFGNGEDGFLFGNFAELDELYTLVPGFGVAVASDSDPVGAALDDHSWGASSYSTVMAAQSELFPDGGMSDVVTNWTYTNASASIVSGAMRLLSTISGVGARTAYKTLTGLTVGATYRVTCDVIGTGGANGASTTIRISAATTAGATIQDSQLTTGAGSRALVFVATATSHRIYVRWDLSTADTTTYVDFDNVSVKQVPGNHGLQATSGARPLWRANSGKPYLQFDGSDDYLQTSLPPSAALTLACAFNVTNIAAAQRFLGGGVSTGGFRCAMGISGGGGASVAWGSENAVVGAVDLTGAPHVMIQTGDSSSRDMYVDGVLISSAATSGGPMGSGANIAVGALNNNGSVGSFTSGGISAALGLNRRITAAEAARITSDFQRTYQ